MLSDVWSAIAGLFQVQEHEHPMVADEISMFHAHASF
jgi:hypothetical protein